MSSATTYRQWLGELIQRIASGRSTFNDARAVQMLAEVASAASEELAHQVGPEGAAALLQARGIHWVVGEADKTRVH